MTARPLRIDPEHRDDASGIVHPAREIAFSGAAERDHRIAEAAYFRAEKRGFAPGWELEDWLAAEREIDALAEAAT